MEQEILEKLKVIIKPYLEYDSDIEKLNMDTNLQEGLNFDSADLVEIVIDIEEAYDIEIDDNEIEKIRTAQDMINLVKAQIE